MARVKTFANAGSFLAADMNSIQDDYEYGYSQYHDTQVRLTGSYIADVFRVLIHGGTGLFAVGSSQVNSGAAFYLTSTDYAATRRTVQMRLKVGLVNNAVDSGVTLTFGLYPAVITAGTQLYVSTVGTLIAGSSVVFSPIGASASSTLTSVDFSAPAAGWYSVCVTPSATGAAGNLSGVTCQLQVRQV